MKTTEKQKEILSTSTWQKLSKYSKTFSWRRVGGARGRGPKPENRIPKGSLVAGKREVNKRGANYCAQA